MGPSFLSTVRKSCMMLIHCQASQREITKQNATKFCDMLESAKFTNAREKFERFTRLKIKELKTA